MSLDDVIKAMKEVRTVGLSPERDELEYNYFRKMSKKIYGKKIGNVYIAYKQKETTYEFLGVMRYLK